MSAANLDRIDDFLDYLVGQRQLAALTLTAYRRDLLELAALLQRQDAQATFTAVDPFQIRKFAAQLHAQGLGARSIARKLSAWRGFFAWLAEQRLITVNPVDGIKPPKRSKTLPKALSADDAVRLVATEQPGDMQSATQRCNHAMFELLYSSGLRVSELVGLDLHYVKNGDYLSQGWIDLAAQEVTVTGKGSKMRSVPIGSAAASALQDWLAIRPTLVKLEPHALFLNERGARMSTRVVQLRLKTHGQQTGLATHVHPHMLRHSFASHVLQSSGDLRAVQEMLGHASISATQIYTSLDFQRLAQVYDAAHPRAKKKSSGNSER
ncbi:tyrosine recombinase XerC [uncultured Oxalicibacterium sp.]|uniref:tyrosine recombinase XerC n=1 Tax=uncultured Oxalicibacterium sp. TaxID=1168540 RepID=UPI0025D81CE0|nr:tyrosine recombinase XerC [uncultured Oxalicibacterium sp.]